MQLVDRKGKSIILRETRENRLSSDRDTNPGPHEYKVR
jgi:hypothetical protein